MRDIFLVKIGEDLDGQASWLRLGDAIDQPQIEHGPLEEATKKSVGARVIALVPSSAVLLTFATVPTQNKQRMLKAIPFALEERLANDVDDLHFAIGQSGEDGATPVAVVDRHLMETWQGLFRNAGLSVDLLIPDVFLVPNNPEQWNLFVDGNSALIRTGDQTGQAFDAENLGFILSLILKKNKEHLPQSIELWKDSDSSELRVLNTDEVTLNTHTNTNGLLGLVTKENLDTERAINLLQGAFSRSEQFGKYLRPWRVAASLAAVWFVIALTTAVIQSSRLEAQSDALRVEAENIFKTAFPDTKKVVKPKVQMQQKIKELKQGSGATEAGFLNLLVTSGEVFRNTAGLILRSVRYKNGVLDVDLELPNLQTLDVLKQSLMASESLEVEIQSAASRNNKVQGRIQIKGKGV